MIANSASHPTQQFNKDERSPILCCNIVISEMRRNRSLVMQAICVLFEVHRLKTINGVHLELG